MDTSLYVNLSYQSSLTRRLELIANNIANVNTVAYKGERVMFDDVIQRTGGKHDISFVIDRASYTDFRSGSIEQTGNQLDVAIVGEGWLQVETDKGVRYTRDGRMVIGPDQTLTNIDGAPVLDAGGGRIQIPQEALAVTISKSGMVAVTLQGEPQPLEIAQIGVFEVLNPEAMDREEDARFGGPINAVIKDDGELRQFAIEGSNINPIKEIIKLMELSRAYASAAESSNDIHKTKKDSISRLARNQG